MTAIFTKIFKSLRTLIMQLVLLTNLIIVKSFKFFIINLIRCYSVINTFAAILCKPIDLALGKFDENCIKKISQFETNLYSKTVIINPDLNKNIFNTRSHIILGLLAILFVITLQFFTALFIIKIVNLLTPIIYKLLILTVKSKFISYIVFAVVAKTTLFLLVQNLAWRLSIELVRFCKLTCSAGINLLNILNYIKVNAKKNMVGFFKEFSKTLGNNKILVKPYQSLKAKSDNGQNLLALDKNLNKNSINHINLWEDSFLTRYNPLSYPNNLIFFKNSNLVPDAYLEFSHQYHRTPGTCLFENYNDKTKQMQFLALRTDIRFKTKTDSLYDENKIDFYYSKFVEMNITLEKTINLDLKVFIFQNSKKLFNCLVKNYSKQIMTQI